MKVGDQVVCIGDNFTTFDNIFVNGGELFTVVEIEGTIVIAGNSKYRRNLPFGYMNLLPATELNKLLYS